MKIFSGFAILLVAISVFLGGCVTVPKGDNDQDKREAIQQMKNNTLADLYKLHPQAKDRIQRSEGYAVFSNVGVHLVFVSAAGGWGIAHDNKTGKEYYMKMASGGLGVGLGAKDFRGIFVFTSRRAFDDFLKEGWSGGLQADVIAKSGEKGRAFEGATTIAPNIDLYQITENGLALQANIQGTKFYLDGDLNYR